MTAAGEPAIPTATARVVGRLKDFFGHRTPWHRRLWNVGTSLGLREVVEYADACMAGAHGRTDGLQFVIATARREVARDPGVGPLAGALEGCLTSLDVSSTSKIPRAQRDELDQLLLRVEAEYLGNWCGADEATPVEFAARALGSHLLDLGYSADHLHRWITKVGPGLASLADLAAATQTMVEKLPVRSFTVFVPCAAPLMKPPEAAGYAAWLDGKHAATWLDVNVEEEHRRHGGGFVVEAQSRDPWSAVEAARRVVARADARVKVARPSGDSIRLNGWARVAGDARSYEVHPRARQVEIGSLHRQGAVYDFDGGLPAATDDALELASYMESTSDGAAVTGGWAAIEALMIRPGEGTHHLAADRLASLVTCSLPRAELTPLAYRHLEDGEPSDLVTALKGAPSNLEKVRLVERHLAAGGSLKLTRESDLAAQARLVAMLAAPAAELARVRTYVTESLRRLYYQRNTIAHSGSLGSASLQATVRTSFCLVGAGLDRIVHAQLEAAGEFPPLGLVARADTEIGLLGTAGARELCSLLE